MTADEIRSKALSADTTEQAIATALEILQEIAAQLAGLNQILLAKDFVKKAPRKPGVWIR